MALEILSDDDNYSSYYYRVFNYSTVQCRQFVCTASFTPYSDPVMDAEIIPILQMGKMVVQEDK